MNITQDTIDMVLEIYYNETEDLDEIADRMDLDFLTVAHIIEEDNK